MRTSQVLEPRNCSRIAPTAPNVPATRTSFALPNDELAFAETARKTGERGVPALEVAKVVEHALTAETPKTRYLVGREAKVLAAMKKVIPDRLLDRLVAREMGI